MTSGHMPFRPGGLLAIALLSVAGAACAERDPEMTPAPVAVSEKAAAPAADTESPVVKPSPPISIKYRLGSTPAVNEPLVIEVDITAGTTGEPVMTVAPRGELALGKSQSPRLPLKIGAAAAAGPTVQTREVVVVPLQNGRSYLNVLVEAQHEGQPVAKAVAIPIQTGDEPPVLEQMGNELEADGEVVNSLPATRED